MRHSLAAFIAFAIFCAVLIPLSQLPTAHADITWTGDIYPADPTTWDSSTAGFIGKTGNGTLTVDADSDLLSRWCNIGYESGITGEVTVDGAGTTWTNSENLHVGCEGNGTLNITGGGTVSNDWNGCIGDYSGSTGQVTVDGDGSTWTNHSSLYVGYEGSGTLAIADGGTVYVNHATYVAYEASSTATIDFGSGGGTLTIGSLHASPTQLTGTGTVHTRGLVSDFDLVFDSSHGLAQTLTFDNEPGQDITVNLDMSDPEDVCFLGAGYAGSGTLAIQDGITVRSEGGHIGSRVGSTGAVTIAGAGSTWNSGWELHVGESGNGTLVITDGGFVRTQLGYIGYEIDSIGVAKVSGAGSTWTGLEQLFVGYSGNAMLEIANGGYLEDISGGFIGCNPGSTGEVTVTGAGSSWNGDSLYVGRKGSGTFTITGGGTVSNSWVCVGEYSGSIGDATVRGAGSTWTIGLSLSVGREGSGTLAILNGGLVTVGHNARVEASLESNNRLLFGIGNDGPGLLAIEGVLEIGFNATLLVTVDDGILLNVGDQFTVVTFDTISGTFTNEPISTFTGDYLLDWAVHYNANDITLEVETSVLAADFDEDGDVDGDDFLAWQTGFGTPTSATHTQGDADADGDTDGKDFLIWQTQFGSSVGNGSLNNMSVPEPVTLVLLGIGAMGFLGSRRRTAHSAICYPVSRSMRAKERSIYVRHSRMFRN